MLFNSFEFAIFLPIVFLIYWAIGYAHINDRLKLRLLEAELENHPERIYDGIVTKVVSGGLQVEVAEYGIYGFVEKERLFGRRGFGGRPDVRRSEWQVGDFLCLRLHRIDFARGSALFAPAR